MTFNRQKLIGAFLLLIVSSWGGFKLYRKSHTRTVVDGTLNSHDWNDRIDSFSREPRAQGKIVFLGDSLTESFDLETFGGPRMINRGISGISRKECSNGSKK